MGVNLAIVIPDGVGVRNFLLGPFLQQATQSARVDILHAIPDGVMQRSGLSALDGTARWHPLYGHPDGRFVEFLRYALAYAHMQWMGTELMRLQLSLPIAGTTRQRRLFDYAARSVGRAAGSQRGIRLLDRWHCRVAGRARSVQHYRRLFQEWRPSVLFCSHQRPPQVVAPVLAARSLGIPTATFIFSWDNLSSKGRVAAPFDHFLVWAEVMRQELLRYYPDVSPDRVHIVGTPQFEPYADRSLLWSRTEFFRRIGGDESRPLICYSGGDEGASPGDPASVRVMMDQIRAGLIQRKPQVLLRPAPVDVGRRYDAVRAEYPELLYCQPAWVVPERGTWADVMPLPGDLQFLANLTHHSDLNVNWASTMTLDFATQDKPIVNLALDGVGILGGRVPAWKIYSLFNHYRPVCELGAARLARTAEELAAHVNAYLANPALDRENRRRLVELEVGWPLGQSSRRIVDVLESISL
jgi:hypothetical protein